MEISRSSLDDIYRPASGEQTGTRVSSVTLSHMDRNYPTTPFSLEVLTTDAVNALEPSRSEETASTTSLDEGPRHVAVADEKGDDCKLQRAVDEMRRLDEILSATICREKELKRQTKELKAKLWQDLLQQNSAEARSECDHEASNTRLFLTLEAPTGPGKEDVSVPLFETQVLDHEHDVESQHVEQREKSPDSMIKSAGRGRESGEGQLDGSHCAASNSKKKQKNYVKRNIELVSAEGGQVLMTQAEKERLAELLREIDEEEEESARGADSKEDMWAVSVLTGQGYTPEPSDLEQLIDVDFRIRHLFPAEEYLPVQSSYTNLSMSQDNSKSNERISMKLGEQMDDVLENEGLHFEFDAEHILDPGEVLSTREDVALAEGFKVGWRCDGDPQPGEKVLQDIRERRGQERRLQEIQQQLEILGQVQDMTNDDLTDEQLCELLNECEPTASWSHVGSEMRP